MALILSNKLKADYRKRADRLIEKMPENKDLMDCIVDWACAIVDEQRDVLDVIPGKEDDFGDD